MIDNIMKEKLYNKIAKYYDLFNFSDYNKQSEFISRLVKKNFKQKNKTAIKILDLACGTGEHIKILKKEYKVEGLDINKGMIRIAKNKNPNTKITRGNLCDLKLPKNSYDAIVCLSSSLQYILQRQILEETLNNIYLALKPKGIFIFDLAYCKEFWQEGYVGVRTVIKGNLQIAEIFKSRSKDHVSLYNPIYLINNNGKMDFFIDQHKIYLYSIKEVKRMATSIFRSVKIHADYTEKLFSFKKKSVPIFILKK